MSQQMINYPHVASMVFDTPLYATRGAVDAVKAVLEPRLTGRNLADIQLEIPNQQEPSALTFDEEREVHNLTVVGKLAIIRVHGLLAARRGHITQACTELISYEHIRAQITAAMRHELVEEVVLDLNSGGGMAVGCKELADYINESKQIKPITAIVNFGAYSACYYIAAACSKIICSPTGGVGSVGVIIETFEISKYEEAMGIKYNTFYRGGHKNDGSPHEPITDQTVAEINKRLDDAYKTFTESVASYRGIDLQTVIDTEARLLSPKEALEIGFIDEIAPAQNAVDALAQQYVRPAPAPGRSIGARAAAMNIQTQL